MQFSVRHSTGVTGSPGKTLSDVKFRKLVLVVLNIYNTVHSYNIKKSVTITGKAAILEPKNETNIWVASVDANQNKHHTHLDMHQDVMTRYDLQRKGFKNSYSINSFCYSNLIFFPEMAN